jgi:ATP-binding cassette subfamily B (MDR/TAP) protein 1
MYQSMAYAMLALIFYYGMLLVVDKREISMAQVMQVVNLLMFGVGTATGLLSAIPQLIMAQATAKQLLGYTKLPMGHEDATSGRRASVSSPVPVAMHNLDFAYPNSKSRKQVLKNLNLSVEAGQCTAIVGHSGCGKSTVVSLLLGLYPPSEDLTKHQRAPLTFGHVSRHDIDMEHLRSKIAYVAQAPFLFPASIADNIAYGIPEGSPSRHPDAIVQAAEAAGLHYFISSLPNGYSTIVGDGGQTLSGGQAQRVSIARALIRQPQLLLMDEPTSALDTESAEQIRHTIRDLIFQAKRRRSEMAIVMVTHNREMMTVADKIFVMEAGRVVEEGRFPELWERGGTFRHLVSGIDDGRA